MGQAGSSHLGGAQRTGGYTHGQPQAQALPQRRAHTLPHEPPRMAPKVLPPLDESPRLRTTDNGNILHSGGTISGRRPNTQQQLNPSRIPRPPRGPYMHSNVFRSRSAGAAAEPPRERDPLHRSHTNLDLRDHSDLNAGKRFGSEPDLRVEEDASKLKSNNKHFRKKYRAPLPPAHDSRDGSSPDSSEGNSRTEPTKKLRLFKTRTETKKFNRQSLDTKIPLAHRNNTKETPHNKENEHLERRYKSPTKDKEQHLKYPDSKDMVQSISSLKREENILQTQTPYKDYKAPKISKSGGCRAKTSKFNEQNEVWKTPLLDRNFRHSDRFKREQNELTTIRREKSFDTTLISSERESDPVKSLHASRIKAIGEQLRIHGLNKIATDDRPHRKSLPSLLIKNNEEKDEFQAELKKATNRFKNEIIKNKNDINLVSEDKPSHHNKTEQNKCKKEQPTKSNISNNKVRESSQKTYTSKSDRRETNSNNSKLISNKRNVNRSIGVDKNHKIQQNILPNNRKNNANSRLDSKQDIKGIADRGQASGKESTPEHSPTRKRENNINNILTREKTAPSKQFYFGMIESKHVDVNDNLKDFPGLGGPIIEEFSNFHLIEKKLLSYHDTETELDKFTHDLQRGKKTKNLSSESALSSEGEDEGGSNESLGIALRLRPTIPKKQPAVPRFSPAAAWRQLATLDAHLAAAHTKNHLLAVETKVAALGQPSAESPPRSDQSGDKSGDSGISGDHANSDPRIESPSRQRPPCGRIGNSETWTPQQDLGDSSSDGTGGGVVETDGAVRVRGDGLVTYSARGQPFSLSLPRDPQQDKSKQLQQGFSSLQKLKRSVSGALGAALGSRRFDLEHEPMLEEPQQNWFLTKSAPNSLTTPLLQQHTVRTKTEEDIKEEVTPPPSEKETAGAWRGASGSGGASYLSWGGHVMYLPPAPRSSNSKVTTTRPIQPLSLLGPMRLPIRSKSSGELEVAARAARAGRNSGELALVGEMRERERSSSPVGLARAIPARVEPSTVTRNASASNGVSGRTRGKRFTFQSTVRQLERRKIAEKLSREADLKEQQRRTELEAMRRVEEEFQRKRAREKASIRQQLRLVSNGGASMPPILHHKQARDEPEGACIRDSPAFERGSREGRQRHSNASSEISGRSKSTTPIRCVELSEWRTETAARQYRDWGPLAAPSHDHPPACARMPKSPAYLTHNGECESFSGSPRSDNYRLEFARGVPRPKSPRSPRTPRPPRLLTAPRSPSTSGSELSHISARQPIRIRW